MIEHPHFAVEPWAVRETALDLDVLAQAESVFALSNGHIGLRANLDEGEPHGLPGTYLNSVYELRPLPYAEAGYGYPESSQTVINVTNGKILRLLVDDEPFDVRYGTLVDHERVLSLRDGVLERHATWTSPAGRTVRVTSTRLVSFIQRSVAAIAYEVEPLDGPAAVVVQSELVANEQLPAAGADPRTAAVLDAPLVGELHRCSDTGGLLVHTTRRSGLRVGAAMHNVVDGPDGTATAVESEADLARLTITASLVPGQRLRVVKFLAYGWSERRSLSAVRSQVEAALASARDLGWDALAQAQRTYMSEFWAASDVEVDGDPEVQQAVRFALFHLLQASARVERRPIPAKGLTGPGYDGHAFWDTESFVMPVLTYTAPSAVADALGWRASTLPTARLRATLLGRAGAAFPWRTINGEECSGYWPAGTAAFHINADIADAVGRYVTVTGDTDFERDTGIELLVETARLWHDLGHFDRDGRFRIDGITGPDEYSALGHNNVYTNLMAQRNLRLAADAVDRHPDRAADLHVGADEVEAWGRAADAVLVPYDDELGVHAQDEGYTQLEVWDFAASAAADAYPLLLHAPYFDLYRKQVVKQADVVLALHLRGDAFTAEEKARDFDYYEALTVRDSSLSACTQAVIAAEVGHLQLAQDYLGDAALMDLDDLEHNTADGVHMASLAGTWLALVAGFGGLRDHGGQLSFGPRLPTSLERLAFTIAWRRRRLRVEVRPGSATYALVDGEAVDLRHHGDPVTVAVGAPVTRPIEPVPPRPAPSQPAGRAPRRRG